MRFKAQDEGRPLPLSTCIAWESDEGHAAMWRIEGAGSDGSQTTAVAFAVEDSSAGTSLLIVGGDHGLRLIATDTGERIAQPYLLRALGSLQSV